MADIEEPEDTNVVDLVEALRRSLGKGGGSFSAKKAPAKKPPQRPTAKRKKAS